ncbi:tyrosine-type recombinase/integrase [Flintibacter sp. BX5]|uniref:Tyrosine-type recombinase/integrase n=2 Tax=Flintibacter faecis TaxID=2763047 RepID=A0A8J6M1Y2_9FIRM|nr:tyrosine-type recombinase/integrase [Flintibacter faecis]
MAAHLRQIRQGNSTQFHLPLHVSPLGQHLAVGLVMPEIQHPLLIVAGEGKIRTILLPHRLCRKLQKYAKQQKIASGKLFLTQDGLPVSRQSIWTRMKALCEAAGVERSKVFPHNLRSLFARSFYGSCHDVVRLADVLGHSSIETTRIYLMSTGKEYLRQLDKLGLVQ